jgi:uncharacterized membrane protein
MRTLPSPSAGCCVGVDINNRGTVVGTSFSPSQTVVWQRGHMPRLLPNLTGWPISWARGLNDRGDIVGRSLQWEGDASGVATLWLRGATAQDLNELVADDDPLKPCAELRDAVAINNRGEIAANGADNCDFTAGHVYRLIPL